MQLSRVIHKAGKVLGSFALRTPKESIKYARHRLNTLHSDIQSSCWITGRMTGENRGVDISIILPTYNNEKYVIAAIESVLTQNTNFKYELIVINDGSTDRTEELLQKYSSIGSVKIVNQKNRGFSGARNVGLTLATGRYLMFVDSDDQLCEGAIEELMQCALKYDADVVAGGFNRVTEMGNIENTRIYQDGKIKPLGNLHGQPWGKIYKRELFRNIQFPEGYWYEDSIFAHLIWPQCQKVYTIKNVVYNYTINTKGISCTSIGNIKSIDSLYIYEALLKDRNKFGLSLLQEDYYYFLRMVKLTYHRTSALDKDIRKMIFIVQCDLYEKNYSYMDVLNDDRMYREMEKALKLHNYGKYIRVCELL